MIVELPESAAHVATDPNRVYYVGAGYNPCLLPGLLIFLTRPCLRPSPPIISQHHMLDGLRQGLVRTRDSFLTERICPSAIIAPGAPRSGRRERRADAKTMERPSGDHTGQESAAGSLVIGRLEVAMDDALLLRRVQRVGDLAGDGEDLGERNWLRA
jgi:hypothetical protein